MVMSLKKQILIKNNNYKLIQRFNRKQLKKNNNKAI